MFLIGLLIGAFVGTVISIIIMSCIIIAGKGDQK